LRKKVSLTPRNPKNRKSTSSNANNSVRSNRKWFKFGGQWEGTSPSASLASLSWRPWTSDMACQTYEKTAKIELRNCISQFSVAHQTGSSSFQPNLAYNSSSVGRALPETENWKWMRLSRRPGGRHKLGTFRQKSKITIFWRHFFGQFQPYPVHIWQSVRGYNPFPPPVSLSQRPSTSGMARQSLEK